MNERTVRLFGLLLLLDFLLTLVMLATDKNLQTGFGSQSPYYLHWYGALGLGVLDLLAGLTVLGFSSMPALRRMSILGPRRVVIAALAWTLLAILASVGIIATYSQVGFSTPGQFAQYLFSVTAYPGAMAYIPWLYDLLLVAYLATAAVGGLALLSSGAATADPSRN